MSERPADGQLDADSSGPGGSNGYGGDAPVACATCGTLGDPGDATVALTWGRGSENGRDVWTCPACSRQHLRSIEGKLDSAWW